jgi:energy-coupling factor transporter ATP-binding protein EcfA2
MKALFIYGPQGSGKTHMAVAIAQLCKSESNGEEILYWPAKKRIGLIHLLNAGVVIVEECESGEDVIDLHYNAHKLTIENKMEQVRFIFTSQHDFDLPMHRFVKLKAAYQ